jgi:RsiW-degrading membrane proteinase PrsW (M82 family)
VKHAGLVAWLAIFASFFSLPVVATVWPPFARSALLPIAAVYLVFAISGTLWMIYDAMRYEQRPWKFVIAAFLFGVFVWYYLDRARWRDESQRLPLALRHRRPS